MEMTKSKILWADDEIDMLKPHIMFLRNKGLDVVTANNGRDALDMVAREHFDIVILDEHMPGLSGLETLALIKQFNDLIPVVMITKSEEEDIMNQAIGSKIADYLIKPVNPNQILLSIKKILQSGHLVNRQTATDYRMEFSRLAGAINRCDKIDDWYELYRRLVSWEIKLSSSDPNMAEMLHEQMSDANATFGKWVKANYEGWFGSDKAPLMSHNILKQRIFPLLDSGRKLFMLVIDNLRLDQWQAVRGMVTEGATFSEELYTSILPTATQYARNALFSGLTPSAIAELYPTLWSDEDDEESKNLNEERLIAAALERNKRNIRFSYMKVNDSATIERISRDLDSLANNDLNLMVINTIDMLSHARTESRMMRELVTNSAAYRSITESWFRHSAILELIKKILSKGFTIMLTSDHGTIQVKNAVKIISEKDINSNLRYKVGRHLTTTDRNVYEVKQPQRIGLPRYNLSSTYVFATGDNFFAYPNNYNQYAQYYHDTFQHGGISMEEMLVPLILINTK
jgi:CheY-like chemotaxis protein